MSSKSAASKWLRRALRLASANVKRGGGPFGAVIVSGDNLVAEGANRVTASNDPTAHAEVTAIREACRKLGRFDLAGCEIFSSCEPCPMCLGAIYWARIDRIWFAGGREDAAAAGFDDSFLYDEIPLPVEARSLRATRLLRREGKGPFRTWRAAESKVLY